ncbi:hypothetical protein [Algoriphagus sp. AK58]|uniref:hypothetical protein n=1 Tax=Algoriphagus sp. AK58 TaxID=1406877 RepID=UPI001650A9B3|nr:hypothetical protein [Algoriphagus sp. AK58]MBC6366934.1 hypothetical protein [Algoriphagus sp. AK58]
MDFYLNQVLNAFSKMDAQLLGELLDPDQTYQDVPQAVFIRKMEELFREFREDGDEHLEVEPGNCCELNCNPDLIRTAYRFVGNNTLNYLDLRFIIEPTADLRDHCIRDIFECSFLRCHQPKEWYGSKVYLTIYDDEKLGYYLSPDEILHTEIALKAQKELKEGREVFDMEEVQHWLDLYQPTFEFILHSESEMPGRLLRWNAFFGFYQGLKSYLLFFEKWERSLVVESWRLNLDLPEEVLMEVILDGEKIIIENEHEYVHYILKAEEGYRVPYHLKPLVGGSADTFSDSWEWFKSRQEPLVKKYYALTDLEASKYLTGWEVMDPEGRLKSLTFHLDVREKAKNRGEEIPFGLWGSRK